MTRCCLPQPQPCANVPLRKPRVQPPTRYRRNVTGRIANIDLQGQPPRGLRILPVLPTAQLQLPGLPSRAVTVKITTIADEAFAPIKTQVNVTTDSQGFFTVELPLGARYVHFELFLVVDGEQMAIHCYSPESTLPIWDDDLTLRAALLRANRFAIDTSGIDHTPAPVGYGEQIGPCKASRAMAIVHAAMFEAVNSIVEITTTQFGVAEQPATASKEAAIAQALHDTLVWLFPLLNSNTTRFSDELIADLATVPNGLAKQQGILAGSAAAAAVIAVRSTDGAAQVAVEETWTHFRQRVYGVASDNLVPFPDWKIDPVAPKDVALGSRWATPDNTSMPPTTGVQPFTLTSQSQFRAPPALDLTQKQFALNLQETNSLGGDGIITPTVRSQQDTEVGQFWAYDAAPVLCAPVRLYNQIGVQLATENGVDTLNFARFLALLNIGMADAGIAAWDTKYFYDFGRPVTVIRDIGTNNPDFTAVPDYTPFGAPATNAPGPNFTPPFPAYVSGHATFGGALFQILRRFLGTDNVPFTFISDEYNGHTNPPGSDTPRPLKPRSYTTLSQAEEENGQSRMFLGIHWNMDKTEGIAMGQRVGDWAVDHWYLVA